jgi:hypothetical protein
MAGKVTTMSKIKQLIQLHAKGVSNRQIAKQLSLNKGTVNDYVSKLSSIGMSVSELLHLDEPVLEGKFKAGTAALNDAGFEEFRTLLPYSERELAHKHVTRNLLWREYLEQHSQGYRYTQFCFHLNQQIVARKPSAILTHEAGEKLFVEGQVHIIYSRVYAKLRNQQVFSLEELNWAIAEKTLEHNQTRMQRHDYSREEKFLADEKETLRPLPASDFEKKYYAELKVENNCCVYLARDKHYYSVPYQHIGEKVQLIYTRTLVKIFCRNALVATHERTAGYGYTTQPEHLCSAHRFYRDRSPEFYIRQAEKKSEALKSLIEAIFENLNRPPELSYKTCDGLISLSGKSDPIRFEKACRIALNAEKYSYRFVESLNELPRGKPRGIGLVK